MDARLFDMPRESYHADEIDVEPTLSASVAKLLVNASPAHAREAHPKLRTREPEPADPKFDVGTVVHSLMLEGHGNVAVVPYDDWRTNAAKEMRDRVRADGLTPLLHKQWDEVRAMEEAVLLQLDTHHATPPLFNAGKAEQTIVWEDDGVLCRARLDWLRDDLAAIDDLKTTSRTANPETWCRTTMYSIGADVQAAFYLRGVRALTGKRPVFRFVVAETTPPYAISVVTPGPSVLDLANAKVDMALTLWKRCLATDDWPAYPRDVCHAEVPGWELARWMEREARQEAAA